jgi:hypothetical protein
MGCGQLSERRGQQLARYLVGSIGQVIYGRDTERKVGQDKTERIAWGAKSPTIWVTLYTWYPAVGPPPVGHRQRSSLHAIVDAWWASCRSGLELMLDGSGVRRYGNPAYST